MHTKIKSWFKFEPRRLISTGDVTGHWPLDVAVKSWDKYPNKNISRVNFYNKEHTKIWSLFVRPPQTETLYSPVATQALVVAKNAPVSAPEAVVCS